jgi:hypothetical protein
MMEFGIEADEHGYQVVAPKSEFAIGCDVGQSRDFCAVAALEKRWEPITVEQAAARGVLVRSLGRPFYRLRGLNRFPLGTGYEQILLGLKNLRQTTPEFQDAEILMDLTGNRGLADLAKRFGLRIQGVQIVAGDGDRYDDRGWRNVGKGRLVNMLQAVTAAGDLKLPPPGASVGADLLRNELRAFAMTISAAGNPIWGNADASVHDDTVTATSLALLELKAEGRRVAVQQVFV